jgi:phosphoserine phosphatase
MKLILARHGQTEWNEKRIFRGRADMILDEVGIKQAEALAGRLSNYKIKEIYSSPLQRAFETARIIGNGLSIAPVSLDGFTELICGRWQGLSLEKVKIEFPEMFRDWMENPQSFVFPEGESLHEVKKRVNATLSQIMGVNKGRDLLIVSHRAINKVILCSLLSLDNSYFWKFKQDLGAIHVIDFTNERISVDVLNDTSHLKGMMQNDSLDF